MRENVWDGGDPVLRITHHWPLKGQPKVVMADVVLKLPARSHAFW